MNSIACKCYDKRCRIKSFCHSLPTDATRTIVNSLVVSKIDYCNCLLAGTPANLTDKLQSVMNATASIVCGLKKYDHITSHVRDSLHWLPVPQRVMFKLLRPGLRTCWTTSTEKSATTHQSRKDSACVQNTVEDTSYWAKLWTVKMTHFLT